MILSYPPGPGKDVLVLVRLDLTRRSACICPRVESPTRYGEAGWLHKLGGDCSPARRAITNRSFTISTQPPTDFGPLAEEWERRLAEGDLRELAKRLGVSPDALRRLGVGWNGAGFTFPMSDPTGQVMGIRIRYPTGHKAAVKGSRQGLFIPDGLTCAEPLLIADPHPRWAGRERRMAGLERRFLAGG